MSIPNYPCYEVKKFGDEVSDALYDATCYKLMDSSWGYKTFDVTLYREELRKYIQQHIDDADNNSIAIIYAAMRTKEKELEDL